ncbi:MAG: signal peptide peptidase SppA [Nitrospirae bacterium]|nr:MAG: signal peptide peptidase SppA [Nitrospirota bacterium]
MSDEITSPRPKRRPVRTALTIVALIGIGFIALSLLGNFLSEGGWIGGDKVAVIRIEGIILDSRETIEELRHYRDNPSVKAIVLRIDSPGGAVVPSQEIFAEVRKTKAEGKIKVVTSMGNVAASGGYYIAAATDRIVANPGTLTGSIGVIMELANVKGLLEKFGVQSVVIKSGRHKDMASPFRAMTPEDRALLQTVLDDVHAQFIDAVATGRSLQLEQVKTLADGRIFTGKQAQTVNLVDELGDLHDAIQLAARLVGISGEPRVIETHKRFSWRDLLQGLYSGSIAPLVPSNINLKYLLAF